MFVDTFAELRIVLPATRHSTRVADVPFIALVEIFAGVDSAETMEISRA